MGKLTNDAIRAWIKAGERFEGRTDGDGLVLTWRPDRTAPHWRLRCSSPMQFLQNWICKHAAQQPMAA
jgi:hypothetical protein